VRADVAALDGGLGQRLGRRGGGDGGNSRGHLLFVPSCRLVQAFVAASRGGGTRNGRAVAPPLSANRVRRWINPQPE
jgi:hypothetical protein